MTKIYKKADDIVRRKIAEETILVPIRGELVDMQKIFSLNKMADYIWESLDGKKRLSDIRNGILDDFHVTKQIADKDLEEFVTDLVSAGLIIEV